MDKEIYGHLSACQRSTDGALRDAQADLLKLVIPIINVMEIINNNSANLTSDSLCARTILKMLGDALIFAGNVNLALIKRTKEALRPCQRGYRNYAENLIFLVNCYLAISSNSR